MSQTRGTLYLVATPIGNLEDVTRRALRVLSEADVVACEDTRRTRSLLEHFGIRARTVSYHEHNERERAEELALSIEEGQTVALVSDAGTPGINDPGYRLVRACVERNLSVVPVPGPTAFVAALTASGLPTDEFYFGGFLPARSHARRESLASVKALRATLVFYETPHRIAQALADALEVLGERKAVVARELTKMHEEIIRGRLSELATHFTTGGAARGEMVLVIDRDVIEEEGTGLTQTTASVAERVAALEAEGLDPRAALKRAARELGLTRDEAYRRLTSERTMSKRRED
ncbi:MAG: rRNA (cytidine1402-2-O)-methyltransferase [Acidobacteriota bacterium]|jgi:16S rRNA (cytidine1402-2'-O)-methyltransferase|nr:rRNA (cytidine1402-2-O)-methyltransferase [Acidobacteriota bacterium]